MNTYVVKSSEPETSYRSERFYVLQDSPWIGHCEYLSAEQLTERRADSNWQEVTLEAFQARYFYEVNGQMRTRWVKATGPASVFHDVHHSIAGKIDDSWQQDSDKRVNLAPKKHKGKSNSWVAKTDKQLKAIRDKFNASKWLELCAAKIDSRPVLTWGYTQDNISVTGNGYALHMVWNSGLPEWIEFDKSWDKSDCPFPDFLGIIPRATYAVIAETTLLVSAVKRAMVFARDTADSVRLYFTKSRQVGEPAQLVVHGRSAQYGECMTTLDVTGDVGLDDFSIALNGVYLLNALKGFEGYETVPLHFASSNAPLGVGTWGDKYAVIMPMSVDERSVMDYTLYEVKQRMEKDGECKLPTPTKDNPYVPQAKLVSPESPFAAGEIKQGYTLITEVKAGISTQNAWGCYSPGEHLNKCSPATPIILALPDGRDPVYSAAFLADLTDMLGQAAAMGWIQSYAPPPYTANVTRTVLQPEPIAVQIPVREYA